MRTTRSTTGAAAGSTRPRRPSARAERTRGALLVAALEVFDEVGFDDATISSISRRAGVSHGSFYTHFSSKEEIFRDVIRAINAEEIHRRTLEPPAVTLQQRIERTNRRFFETYRLHARTLASYEALASRDEETRLLRRSTRHTYIERTLAAIRRWQDEGLVDPGLDAEALSHCLGSMVERVAHMQFVFGDGCDDERMMAGVSHVWATALGLPDTAATAGASSPRPAAPTRRKRRT